MTVLGEPTLFHVAEYIRLSREDGDKSESDSIGNQRKLIAEFLKNKAEFVRYQEYVDSGWTGTNYDRPAFQRMLADLEAGRANCVIVKDLSRFGRDYLDTGKYLERYFPARGIRFIAIIDHIDSFRQAYDLLLPIKNIFNEQYARDISNKIHASVQTKQRAGEFIGAFASYGYQKSPADKNRLIIDPYAAAVVRRIFTLYLGGYGKSRIAAILNEQGIVCPSEYKKLTGENYRNSRRLDGTTYWTYSTINRLLQNEMYLGHMVQGQKSQQMREKPRIKDRKDWVVVKDTHEAIIDRDTWNQVQELLKHRTRELDLSSNLSIFAGYLKCGDCGRSLTRKGQNYYCGTYVRSGRQYCTPHAVSHRVLEEIILADLRELFRQAGDLRAVIEQIGQMMKTEEPGTGRTGKEILQEIIRQSENKNRLQTELAKVRRLKQAVYEDYREELLSREEYISYRQDYLNKEKLLLGQLESETEPSASAAEQTNKNFLENPWVKQLLTAGTVEKADRNLIIAALHEIRVYANQKIRITYNF